jgi:hypothetical protein
MVVASRAALAEHAGPGEGVDSSEIGREAWTVSTSHQHAITAGRACVRLIEATDALLGYRPVCPKRSCCAWCGRCRPR